jgi:hypothetical protein
MWWVRIKTLLIISSCVDTRSEFKMFHLRKLEKTKENWHEHILRMTTVELPRILPNYTPRGYWNIVRSTARCTVAFS